MIEPARCFLFQTAGAIQQMASAMEAAKVDACFVTDHPAPSAEWLHAHGHAATSGIVGAESKTTIVTEKS